MPFKTNIQKQAENRKYNLKFNIVILSDIVDGEASAYYLTSQSNLFRQLKLKAYLYFTQGYM